MTIVQTLVIASESRTHVGITCISLFKPNVHSVSCLGSRNYSELITELCNSTIKYKLPENILSTSMSDSFNNKVYIFSACYIKEALLRLFFQSIIIKVNSYLASQLHSTIVNKLQRNLSFKSKAVQTLIESRHQCVETRVHYMNWRKYLYNK